MSHFAMAMNAPAKGIIGATLLSRRSLSSPRTRNPVYVPTSLSILFGMRTRFTTQYSDVMPIVSASTAMSSRSQPHSTSEP